MTYQLLYYPRWNGRGFINSFVIVPNPKDEPYQPKMATFDCRLTHIPQNDTVYVGLDSLKPKDKSVTNLRHEKINTGSVSGGAVKSLNRGDACPYERHSLH